MEYSQWVVIHISNSLRNGNITIKEAKVSWGKFYQEGNKECEIAAGDVDGTVISAGSSSNISSCGRSDTLSGTEGSLDLYDGETRICTITWVCPWGAGTNDFQIIGKESGYVVSAGDWNRGSGALGQVDVEVITNA
ncbi:hypothetical protein V500_01818 [Pseudogymnoascus sp. VKM F-4518 (FW-2643)]|nr:hypothetical protein V500_01818 [Pseudogymnoascus sp. VKM F-4518 (FW-2643)]